MTSINLNEIAVRVTRDYINDLIESKFALRVELARVETERETLRARVASLETVLDFFWDRMLLFQRYKARYLAIRIGVYAALEIDMPEISDERLVQTVKELYESTRERV